MNQLRSGDDTVVVVGGGIVGASAAYWVSRLGRRVVLVDNADPGYATAAGAGIVSPGTSIRVSDEIESLSYAAADFYRTLIACLGEDGFSDVGFENPGTLFIAIGEQERERLPDALELIQRRSAVASQSIGVVSRLDAGETRRMFPPLGPDTEAIHVSGGCRINGRQLRAALRSAIETRGGTIISSRAILTETGRDGEWGVEVDGRRLSPAAVILATGSWSYAWKGFSGFELQMGSQRGQILHLDVPSADTTAWPLIVGFGTYYMLTFGPSRVVSGATREPGVGYDYRVTAAGQTELLDETLRVAPGLASATVVETRVGFRPWSPDGNPVCGAVPGSSNTYVATGLGALGLTLGPYIGSQVAEMALGAQGTPALAQFSLERFHV